jgi:hypothetical protein
MRHLFVTVGLIACVWPSSAAAQAPVPAPNTMTPDDLRAPLAPAFALLDATPTSIDRPQAPSALSLNLFSAFREGESFPQNYALDVAPYWLRPHPTLTFDDYYRPNFVQTVARTFSVSLATSTTDAVEATTPQRTSLGLGARALLVAGHAHPSLRDARAALVAVNVEQARLDDSVVDLEFRAQQALAAGRVDDARRLTEAADARRDASKVRRAELSQQARDINLRIQALDVDRVGLVVSVAAAQVIDFTGDRFDNREVARWGVWLTPAYRILVCGAARTGDCHATLDVMVVVRYIAERRGSTDDSTWDVGGRILWQPTREFGVSAETVRRAGTDVSDGASSTRTVGLIEYRLRNNLALFASFGKNFEDTPGGRTLVSLLGLNIVFGRKPVIDLAK